MDVTRATSNLTEQPKHIGQRLVVWIVCLAMTACAPFVTRQSVERKHETIAAELEIGDRVEVLVQDGQEYSFRVKEIRETEFVGETGTDLTPGKIVTVQYQEITRLERVDQHPLVLFGTIGGAAVIFVVGGLLLLAIVTA